MIQIKDIEKRYYKRIPRKFRIHLEKYINIPYVQEVLGRALRYELTDRDNKEVFAKGKQGAEYSGLYYIAFIFIHPLTIAQAILDCANRITKAKGVK